jgi:DNA-binding LytR/AlgR family response regulator
MVAKLVGFSRSGVRDGQAALAALERDPTVELVVSDIVMPGGMSGLELARMLREHRPGLPVLLATGYSQYAAQVVREAFALVEKPYYRDVLAASLVPCGWAAAGNANRTTIAANRSARLPMLLLINHTSGRKSNSQICTKGSEIS